MPDIIDALIYLFQTAGLAHGQHRKPSSQIHDNAQAQQAAADARRTVGAASAGIPQFTAGRMVIPNTAIPPPKHPHENTPEPEDTGLEFGEIRAWRVWMVGGIAVDHDVANDAFVVKPWPFGDSTHLRSVVIESRWPTDAPMHSPDVGMTRGIHAWKKADDAAHYMLQTRSTMTNVLYQSVMHHLPKYPVFAFGEVDLWGKMYEFDLGWHAEFAKVVTIHCPAFASVEEELRKQYNVTGGDDDLS